MISVLDSILEMPDAAIAAVPAKEREDFAAALHEGRPSIAPVFNIANSIMLPAEGEGMPRVREVLTGLRERESRSAPLIAGEALRETKGDWLMTTSYSSTVRHALLAISEVRPIKVTVAGSAPGAEGRQFARLLSEHMECEVVPDPTVFARMAEVDGAVAGADAITASGLINKVGTGALAEAARVHGVPAYAVCGWSKVCPAELSDLAAKDTVPGARPVEHLQVFERTLLELFGSIITDRGAMGPAELRAALKEGGAARGWCSRGLLRPPTP